MMFTKTNAAQNAFPVIVKAGLLAGVLDITAACIQYAIITSKNPLGVLNFVASGVFGKAALAGGETMALWGLLFHMIIAMSFAVLFFVLCLKIEWLYKNQWLAAVVYGLLVWTIMNLLVVPRSNAPHIPFKPGKALVAAVILVVCIGLPISLMVGNYFKRRHFYLSSETS